MNTRGLNAAADLWFDALQPPLARRAARPPLPMTRDRSDPLDGHRGLAILLVLAGHIAQNYSPLDETAGVG